MARYRGEIEVDDADELRGQERTRRQRHTDGDPDCECWNCMNPEGVEEEDPPFGTAPEDLADDE